MIIEYSNESLKILMIDELRWLNEKDNNFVMSCEAITYTRVNVCALSIGKLSFVVMIIIFKPQVGSVKRGSAC